MQVKIYMIGIVMFLFASTIQAQYEFGFFAGAAEYGGDLAKTPFILSETKVSGQIYGQYYIDDNFAVRGSAGFGKISGKDENKRSSDNRNLSFENEIIDLSVVCVYNILDIELDDFAPYVYAGAGLFHHNPTAEFNGQTVELQPLGTEGQGIVGYADKYDLWQVSIPFGTGFKYALTKNLILNADFGARKTFTDYLDDVGGDEYVQPSVLIQNGQLAVELAYRADELPNSRPYSAFENPRIRKNDPRSISEGDDWYYMAGIGASWYIPRKEGRSEIRKNRKRVPYRYGR